MSDVFLKGLLKQRAVYWAPLGLDNSGQMTFDEAVEIRCLWMDKQVEYINNKGERTVSSCVVLVDRDMKTGGMIRLGKLEDLEDQDEPNKNEGAQIIMAMDKSPVPPSLKKFFRKAIC